jgi:hypothetical protein
MLAAHNILFLWAKNKNGRRIVEAVRWLDLSHSGRGVLLLLDTTWREAELPLNGVSLFPGQKSRQELGTN